MSWFVNIDMLGPDLEDIKNCRGEEDKDWEFEVVRYIAFRCLQVLEISHSKCALAAPKNSWRITDISVNYCVPLVPGVMLAKSLGAKKGMEYNKAIRVLHERMATKDEGVVDMALITCALFLCVELLQGRYKWAFQPMYGGLNMYHKWLYQSWNNRNSSESGIRQVFESISLQTVLFINTALHEWDFASVNHNFSLPSMPSKLHSLDEGRDTLNSFLSSLCCRVISSQLRRLGKDSDNVNTVDDQQRFSHDALDVRWNNPFRDLKARQTSNFTLEQTYAGTILSVQYTAAYIVITAGIFPAAIIFDNFEQIFTQIISTISTLRHFMHRRNGVTFDMGILPSSYLVASSCRDPRIRRHALGLSYQTSRQEGIWDSFVVEKVAERLVSSEESDCSSPKSSFDIPAAAQLSVLNAAINSAQRTIILHYCRQQSADKRV
ncbi:hypothetical protein K461DRAFT_300726 [Myriangium duriaei CBS 260.36]|uniref:Transcription factor domain-containing protein n=1 Tax=Myriangium duriaei CBS 260.36 TaxID=1168546 RepID=A0A9P4ISF3_9PEZI|nr:hypothetical protein K461DRAFT_300726 [Myriangium duriaei CBS 260.36]